MKSLASMDEDDVDQVLEPTHATTALSTHAEASKMLETALQQMDGIIAGLKSGSFFSNFLALLVFFFIFLCVVRNSTN